MAAATQATRVVVIDDCAEHTRILQRALSVEGYDCVAAGGAQKGIELCSRGADVVLLDVELPDGNGLTLCRQLKARPETALIPVLVMTGRCDEHVGLEALKAGADHFLSKPFRLVELLEAIIAAAAGL